MVIFAPGAVVVLYGVSLQFRNVLVNKKCEMWCSIENLNVEPIKKAKLKSPAFVIDCSSKANTYIQEALIF